MEVVVRGVVVISCVILVQDGRLGALQGRAAAAVDEEDKLLAVLWIRSLGCGKCTYLSGMLSHNRASLAWGQGQQRCWLPAHPRCLAAAAAAAMHPPAGGGRDLLVGLVLGCLV